MTKREAGKFLNRWVITWGKDGGHSPVKFFRRIDEEGLAWFEEPKADGKPNENCQLPFRLWDIGGMREVPPPERRVGPQLRQPHPQPGLLSDHRKE